MENSYPPLEKYQSDFIEFLLEAEALTFGDFVTKSGRNTPYFVNTGKFNTGRHISRLGSFYAQHIISSSINMPDSIFGPAYKGVPLCVATSSALFSDHNIEIGYTFNRKEAKDHGDKGTFVGRKLKQGDNVIIVEDVITAGTTIREMSPILRTEHDVSIEAVIISVDRCEKGSTNRSAVDEVSNDLSIPVYPIVTIYQILGYLDSSSGSLKLSQDLRDNIDSYLTKYGAKAQ